MYNNLDKGIIDICRYEYNAFLNKANVIGVGYGYKYIKNIRTNEKVLQVFVEKKVPLNWLYENDQIPSFYKNIKTDVIETGAFSVKSLTKRIRPVTGGYSFGSLGVTFCGTFGGVVTDGEFFYMLSNNHVLADDNQLPIGTEILQPCIKYGGKVPQDIVASLSRFIPIKFATILEIPENYVDCAIAKVSNEDIVSPEIEFIGIPKGIKEAELLMNIKMVGAISELLSGEIVSLHDTVKVKFTEKKGALYKNQFLFTPLVQEGDSGALVLDCNNYVVGLNFAGTNNLSIANPINYVLDALKVQLVTEKNFRRG